MIPPPPQALIYVHTLRCVLFWVTLLLPSCDSDSDSGLDQATTDAGSNCFAKSSHFTTALRVYLTPCGMHGVQ